MMNSLSNMDLDDINRELASLTEMAKEAGRLFRCGCNRTAQLQLERIRRQAAIVTDMIEGITEC